MSPACLAYFSKSARNKKVLKPWPNISAPAMISLATSTPHSIMRAVTRASKRTLKEGKYPPAFGSALAETYQTKRNLR